MRARARLRKGLRPFVIFLAALAVLVALTTAESGEPQPAGEGENWLSKIISPSFWYQVSTNWKRRGSGSKVSIVIIGSDIRQKLGDACELRKFEAHLFRSLAAAGPKVLALDMYFDPSQCAGNNEAAKDSKEVFNSALRDVSNKIPIVFAPDAYVESALVSSRPEVLPHLRDCGFDSSKVVLKPYVPIERDNPGRITLGLGNLDSDNRRLALNWLAYDGPGACRPVPTATFAVVAAQAYDKTSLAKAKIRDEDVSRPGPNPFVGFLPEDKLSINSAEDFMCHAGGETEGTSLSQSAPQCSDLPKLQQMSGRVVVIGQAGPNFDVHESVIGTVPGVILQANYIAAILDRQVLRPLPVFFQVLIGGLWLMLIACPAFFWADSPKIAVPLCLLATAGPALLIQTALISRYHRYTEILAPGVIVVVLFILDRLFDKVLDATSDHGQGVQS